LLESGDLRLEHGELFTGSFEHPALHVEFFACDKIHALERAGKEAKKISLEIRPHDPNVITGSRDCPRKFAGQFANVFSFHDYSTCGIHPDTALRAPAAHIC